MLNGHGPKPYMSEKYKFNIISSNLLFLLCG